jgi:hypothetical protein
VCPSRLMRVQAMLDIISEEEAAALFDLTIERAEKLIRNYRVRGNDKKAASILANLTKQIDGMSPGFWRDEYRMAIEMRFASMIEVWGRGKIRVKK